MAAAEQQLQVSKQDFATAKDNYFKVKGKAQKRYDEELESGMVESGTGFAQWTAMNVRVYSLPQSTAIPTDAWKIQYPQFTVAQNSLQAQATRVYAAAAQIYGDKVWDNLEKSEYFLIPENVHGREHMEGVLL